MVLFDSLLNGDIVLNTESDRKKIKEAIVKAFAQTSIAAVCSHELIVLPHCTRTAILLSYRVDMEACLTMCCVGRLSKCYHH